MMWTLMLTTWRQKRTAIIAYSVAGVALIWMYVAIYPSLQAQAESYTQLMKSLPPTLLKAFGADNLGMANFEGLAGVKHYDFMWPLMMLFLGISLAAAVLAGEVEKRTIGLWVSAPVTTATIYWAKYLAGSLAIVGFVIASVTAVIPLTALAHIDITVGHFLALSIVGGLFGLAIFSGAMLVSSLSSEKTRVYAIVGPLLLLMYLANVLAEITDKLGFLKYYSLFHYYSADKLLSGHQVDPWSYVVFGLVILLCSIMGAIFFERRNLSV